MKKLFFTATILLAFLTSCEKDPHNHNDEELITTVKLEFTNTQNSSVKTFLFKDIDGDGGNAPEFTVDTLDANASYTLAVSLLNESETPSENITVEVEEEGTEHQFFYEGSSALNLSVSYADTDDNGMPIGILNTASTGNASVGTLTVTLRHQPDKNATNVAGGDITNAGGATDVEVTFNVVIE